MIQSTEFSPKIIRNITKPIFLFGKETAFFDKEEKKWMSSKLEENKSIDLPWMGFELTLLQHHIDKVPGYKPVYTIPIQKNSKLIKGDSRAVSSV